MRTSGYCPYIYIIYTYIFHCDSHWHAVWPVADQPNKAVVDGGQVRKNVHSELRSTTEQLLEVHNLTP